MAKKYTSTSPFIPGNAFAYLGLGLLRLLTLLPFRFQMLLAKGLGLVFWYIFPYRKNVGLINLQLCFPDWSEKKRHDTLRTHYQSLVMGVFELGCAWYRSDDFIRSISDVEGLENIEAVKASGRGALLLSGHFTPVEITGRSFSIRCPYGALYKTADQPVLGKAMHDNRMAKLSIAILFTDAKGLLMALREGYLLWYAPDQGQRLRHSAIIPFFGVPAVTNTVTTRIAQKGNAALLPYEAYRQPNGRYKIIIGPEIKDLPSGDPEADGLKINKLVESFVLRAPEQYLWLHKRFKRRGEGYPDVYAKDFKID